VRYDIARTHQLDNDFVSALSDSHVCCFHTEYNELSTAVTGEVWTTELSTEIDAGVGELCWVDVEVTCLVCTVVH